MLTAVELEGLEKGDVVETQSLMPNVTDKVLLLRVTETQTDPVTVKFVALWHSVTLGQWIARIDQGKVIWTV